MGLLRPFHLPGDPDLGWNAQDARAALKKRERTARKRAQTARPSPYRLFDMHCHLDRMANADDVAAEAAERGLALFGVTVTPAETKAASERFASAPNVRIGVGLHPWWLADAGSQADSADRAALMAAQSRFVGEIGLDFGPKNLSTSDAQIQAFELIVRACAERPMEGRVLSIHAVRSAQAALDILERFDMTHQAACIFHWFSGSSDELARARALGCLFSVSEHMLASKRGREYARQIPLDRLLLETDAPPELDAPYRAGQLETSLEHTLDQLSEIRSTARDDLATAIAATSSRLLDL